jgi:hypothetical protein
MPRRNHDFSPHVEPLCTRIAPSGLVAEAADPDPGPDPLAPGGPIAVDQVRCVDMDPTDPFE